MGNLERADRLKSAPIVGRFYLVPALLWDRTYRGYGMDDMSPAENEAIALKNIQAKPFAHWWPVWGRKHSDVEFFNFQYLHYHIDPRFLTKRQWRAFGDDGQRTPLQELQARPLLHTALISGPPRPTLRRMRCTMSHAQWGHSDSEQTCAMNDAFKGQQCAKGRHGFVCPHKLFPLGSVEAVDGVITCPLHGVRVDASSGVCIGNAA